jgi:Dna[CI] antecedent, DciA
MRGKARPTDALVERNDARLAALAAAFAEACGWPLAREVALRGVTHEGRLIAVASSRTWADQVEPLASTLCARVNARLGREVATGLDVRVGPLGR